MKNRKYYLCTLILAILGGAVIGIGGVVYLSLENKVVGALMFTVGLYTIVVHGLNLYTGKVGYIPNNPPVYLVDVAVIWIGNFIGTWLAAQAVMKTRISGLAEAVTGMCQVKLNDSFMSLLILGIFCGALMYIAVEGYKQANNPVILFVCVATFILCGFEHCIADMFYFSLGKVWSLDTLLRTMVISVANGIGGCLIPFAKKWNRSIV
ncbi:MAG: formate/nitrite transporter family protein [Firmicutes bacterium]|nr:formate/nitrite transporter family protein [Bacillota bacterium]